jgi:16S rRNA processing protein RimM
LLPPLEGNRFYYHEIIGFTAIDTQKGPIGTIENVNDQSSQVLLEVTSHGQDILIPLHDDFIVRLDRDAKEFLLELPEGILSLND